MPKFQTFNGKTGAWVKYVTKKKKSRIIDVKQRQPRVPFKNIEIK